MRFLVEDPLTKLARKLRLMGFDTEICSRNDIRKSIENRDVFLTKSKKAMEIASKFGIRPYLIKSENWRSQLKSVIQRFQIDLDDVHFLCRCSKCNGLLEEASPGDAAMVPEYVALTAEKLYKCNRCGQLYWNGSHVEHMKWMNGIVGKSGDNAEENKL
ncbi:MAG: hypothetical protein JW697_07300 [Kosmotogaceae bacterium]|nr:hypothetical protein [Kosmotogaceae bacterium]